MPTGRRADSDHLCLRLLLLDCRPPVKSVGKFNEMKKYFDPFFSGECLSLPFKEGFLKESGQGKVTITNGQS